MGNTAEQARIRQVLQRLVLQAGRMLKKHISFDHQIVFKSEIDMVTEMDQAVENLFIRTIQRIFPDHEILSEEMYEGNGLAYPKTPAPKGVFRWIIDPLDGTTNYAHGFPHFGVSAGVEYNGTIVLGAVYNPMLQELFFAERGKGAWRNGKRIRVSALKNLRQSLLATGFPYDLKTSTLNNFKEFERMSHYCQAVRRAGSASLDLCDVACGRFDGFWEFKLKPWDVAAAALLIAEAGGKITNYTGQKLDVYGGTFIASNGWLHKSMTQVIHSKEHIVGKVGLQKTQKK